MAIAAAAFGPSIVADVPTAEELRRPWFALRSAVGLGGSGETIFREEGGAGLWAWDPHLRTWTRIHPLIFSESGNGSGAAITATADTIVVQGTTFLEFDALTHRLLRRQPALPEGFTEWAFKGEYVPNTTAERLGMRPGYYGFVYCPDSIATGGAKCGPSAFPGNPAGDELNIGNYFFRRELDGSLSLVAILPTGPNGVAGLEARSLALDPSRARFWSMHRFFSGSNSTRFEFGYLPLAGATLGSPVITQVEDPALSRRHGTSLVYDDLADALLAVGWSFGVPITQRPAAPTATETPLDTESNNRSPLAITRLAADLPTSYEQVVPAVGNGPGAYGTYWRSDLWLFNPAPTPAPVRLRRVTRPEIAETIELPPRGSAELSDVLRRLGGGPVDVGGDGTVTDALVITSPYQLGEQVAAYSRNYTHAAGDRGTYGQAIPAVPTRYGYSTHLPHAHYVRDTHADAPEFFLDRRVPERFRHNMGVVNDEADALTVSLYYGAALTPEGEPTRSFVVPPHSVANVSVEALIGPELLATQPSMFKVAATRPAPIWLSMIDNKTGDGTFLPFATFSLYGALDATFAIPQVAHTPGANNTFWRSDLYGYFHPPVSHQQLPAVQFYPGHSGHCDGRTRIDATLGGPYGESGNSSVTREPSVFRRVFPDVVAQFPTCTTNGTMGALEINAGTWMAAFTRTYTTRDDGGTYGDILPLYPADGWPVQHFSGIKIGNTYRINVGLYNGKDYPVENQLVIYDAAGNETRRHDISLAPRQSLQAPLTSLVGRLDEGLYGMTVRGVDTPGRPGRSWAYVALVENETGDTTNLW